MVKDGSALERLAEIDGVAFDKTGTLTLGRPSPRQRKRDCAVGNAHRPRDDDGFASSGSKAIAEAAARRVEPAFPASTRSRNFRGLGSRPAGATTRIGSAGRNGRWSSQLDDDAPAAASVSVLARNGELLAAFVLEDRVRPDAREAVDDMSASGTCGWRSCPATGCRWSRDWRRSSESAISRRGSCRQKRSHGSRRTEAAGRKVLMVGDGLNDAPALAAAHVSMAPATAADIGRNAADFVFLNESLSAVGDALGISRRSAAVDIPELRSRGRLQCPRGACRRAGLRDAPRRGGRDVAVLDHRRRQCHEAVDSPHRPHEAGDPEEERMGSMWWLILIALGMGLAGLGGLPLVPPQWAIRRSGWRGGTDPSRRGAGR